VAEQAGAQSQLTGIVAAGAVLAMLVFVPWLVQNLPQSALAAIVITASFSLFDLAGLRRLFDVRRSEFWLAVVCAAGVILVGVLQGIVVAVLLSIFQVFGRAWRPYSAVLAMPDGTPGYHDVTRFPEARPVDGVLIIRWDAPLFFANASIFRNRVRELVAKHDPPPVWVIVAAEPITDLDSTAADVLEELDIELNAKDIHLVFAELKDPVKDRFVSHGLLETIDARRFYPTLEAAIAAFHAEAPSRATPTTTDAPITPQEQP
jgi:MFS superfamily sulfate permease-like transporter